MTDDSPAGRSSACQAVESGGASRGLWSVVESLDLVRPIDWPTDHLDGRSYLLFRRQLEPRQHGLFQCEVISRYALSIIQRRRLPCVDIDFVGVAHKPPQSCLSLPPGLPGSWS